MPSLSVTFTGNSTQLMAELSRAEAMVFKVKKNIESAKIASLSNLSARGADMDSLYRSVAKRNKTDMMGEKESQVKDEAIRLAEVESVTRSNMARRLLRQRKADAAANAKEIAEAELAAGIDAASRSNMARRLWRERAEKKQMAAAQILADAAISARGYGGGTGLIGGHGMRSPAGIIQETAVIGHEILQGRGSGRILGSISILGQRLGWLRKIIKTTADSDIDAAIASGKLEKEMGQKVLKLESSAVASEAAGSATAANAVADRAAAEAAKVDYVAIKTKTAALTEQAEISKANAKLLPSTAGMLTGGLIAAAVAIFAVYEYWSHRVKKLTAALSGLERPDLTPANLSKMTSAEEGAKKIRDAVRETTDAYNSAAAAADRYTDALKVQFEIEKKKIELMGGSPAAMRALQIREQSEDRAALERKKVALEQDIKDAKNKISKLGNVPSKQDFEDRGANLKDAHESLAKQLKEQEEGIFEAQNPGFFRKLGQKTKYINPISYLVTRDDATVAAGADDKVRIVAAAARQDFAFQKSRRVMEDKIKERERLQDLIAKNEAEQVEISDKLKDLPAQQAAKRKLDDLNLQKNGSVHPELSANQRIGAYAMPMQNTMVQIAQKQLAVTEQSNEALQQMARFMNSNPKSVFEAMAQMALQAINGPFK